MYWMYESIFYILGQSLVTSFDGYRDKINTIAVCNHHQGIYRHVFEND